VPSCACGRVTPSFLSPAAVAWQVHSEVTAHQRAEGRHSHSERGLGCRDRYVALAVLAVGWSLIILMIYQLSKDPSPAQRLRERQRVVKQMHKRDATAAKSQTDKKNE
jgi:hypothetical protein